MSELISIDQIASEKQIDASVATNLIQAAKLKAHKLKIAGESLSLYEKMEAEAVITAHLNKLRDEEAKRLAAQEAAREPTLKEIAAAVKEVGRDVSDVAELQEEIKRLTTANQTIFKALTDFKSDATDRLAGMKTLIVNMRDEVVASGKKSQSTEAAAIEQWKVAVVGISKTHHAHIHNFMKNNVGNHAAIDLKLIEASDIRALHQLRGYHLVFAVRKQTDTRHVEQLKAVKAHIKFTESSIEDIEYELRRFALILQCSQVPMESLLSMMDDAEEDRAAKKK